MVGPLDGMSEGRASLTSPSNPRVKAVVRLRNRAERERTGQTIVDGARELGRAIGSGVQLVEVFVCEPLAIGEEARATLDALAAAGAGWTQVGEVVLEKLAFGNRVDGIVAVVRPGSLSLGDLVLPPDPLVAVVEGVEKPGNLGAIVRSADGAGLDAVVAADARTDVFNPNAIRASLGTIFALPVVAARTTDAIAWLRERGIRIVTARVDATADYGDADLTGSLAIVLGSEADGLTAAWSGPGAGIQSVRLPMHGSGDSLNVSATAAVLFYESVRQRRLADRSTDRRPPLPLEGAR
jgi:RNA methyltransferase, TrmH family